MIDTTAIQTKCLPREQLYVDVLQHLYLCKTFCEDYHERAEITSVKEYVQSDATEPLTIWGEGGCGKSSIMANAYMQVSKLYCHQMYFYIFSTCIWRT